MQRNSSTCETSTLFFDVWLITHLTRRLLDDALRPVGLTADEFGLYSLLYSFGPLTPGRLARVTGMAATTVSGAVRRVTARGHVEAVANPDDARSRLLRLTGEGTRTTIAAAGILDRLLARTHDAFDGRGAQVQAGLADLDRALRGLVGADRRPYGASATARDGLRTVSYAGPPLREAQAAEARAFIEWLRVRDAADVQDAADLGDG